MSMEGKGEELPDKGGKAEKKGYPRSSSASPTSMGLTPEKFPQKLWPGHLGYSLQSSLSRTLRRKSFFPETVTHSWFPKWFF